MAMSSKMRYLEAAKSAFRYASTPAEVDAAIWALIEAEAGITSALIAAGHPPMDARTATGYDTACPWERRERD